MAIMRSEDTLRMDKIKKNIYILYTGLPFLICSVLAMLVHYLVRGSIYFDFSRPSIVIAYVFWGIVLLIVDAIILINLKKKDILVKTWTQQLLYFISYYLVCIISDNYIVCMSKYQLSANSFLISFLMPLIILIFIIIINMLIKLEFNKDAPNQIPLYCIIITILFIFVLLGVLAYYYYELSSLRKWAIEYWWDKYSGLRK